MPHTICIHLFSYIQGFKGTVHLLSTTWGQVKRSEDRKRPKLRFRLVILLPNCTECWRESHITRVATVHNIYGTGAPVSSSSIIYLPKIQHLSIELGSHYGSDPHLLGSGIDIISDKWRWYFLELNNHLFWGWASEFYSLKNKHKGNSDESPHLKCVHITLHAMAMPQPLQCEGIQKATRHWKSSTQQPQVRPGIGHTCTPSY